MSSHIEKQAKENAIFQGFVGISKAAISGMIEEAEEQRLDQIIPLMPDYFSKDTDEGIYYSRFTFEELVVKQQKLMAELNLMFGAVAVIGAFFTAGASLYVYAALNGAWGLAQIGVSIVKLRDLNDGIISDSSLLGISQEMVDVAGAVLTIVDITMFGKAALKGANTAANIKYMQGIDQISTPKVRLDRVVKVSKEMELENLAKKSSSLKETPNLKNEKVSLNTKTNTNTNAITNTETNTKANTKAKDTTSKQGNPWESKNPMFGDDWEAYFKATYGEDAVEWVSKKKAELRGKVQANLDASAAIREASKFGEYLKIEKELLETIEKKKWLDSLKNTENFKQGTKENGLNHIFDGEILKNGSANGFHYEGMPNSNGKIVGNIDPPNEFGVYQATIEVNGVLKQPKSTFFPKEWTPQQVIDAINEAFAKKEVFKNNRYRGNTDAGIKIEMVIRNGKIISAYPLY
ncbi:EndoU domain-containing protein [Paenibacillus lentus]|uniref:EndoU domain-containing protein n=1 Tax=Paenibacillus lentus TaxID=1338368 RepID=UPI001FEA7C54|nr:EndoU domain-containing protein [Paenibacillus lentus]